LVWVAITGIVAILIITTNAPKPTRLLLAIPVGLAALGFLQAREKT
jgi:hypothetical protein